jgi:hypothetical protein
MGVPGGKMPPVRGVRSVRGLRQPARAAAERGSARYYSNADAIAGAALVIALGASREHNETLVARRVI